MTDRKPTRRRLLALALALLAAVFLIASLLRARGEDRKRQANLALLGSEATQWLPVEVVERMRREPDPVWAKILLARALVAAELDSAGPPEEASGAGLERLELARRLAAEALAERPSAWQAPMLVGAATYLLRSEARDPRLLTSYRDWEAPLELAVELAPGKHEAGRFLVTAYLELWPAVSEPKRETARRMLADAFEDPRIFARLMEPWLEVAADREEAFAPIPAEPTAWINLQEALARRRDWEGFRVARQRWREALVIRVSSALEEASARERGGDLGNARELYLLAAAQMPPGTEGLPTLRHALAHAPAGPPGAFSGPLRSWLEWALDLCLLGRCPLAPAALDRLAGLAGDLPAHQAALAALVAERLADAERLERRSDRLWHTSWAPYLIVKARRLLARGDPGAAAATLDRIHPAWKQRTLYWLLRREIATAAGNTATRTEAEQELGHRTGGPWPLLAWDRGARADRLEMLLAEPAAGVAVTLSGVPAEGAVLELRLDGGILDLAVVRPGDDLEMRSPLPPGLHLLELETLAGGRVIPGAARRIDP